MLKRKHFGKDVWEKVVEDFLDNTVNASKEARLLQSHHPLLQISQRSVLRIWTTYLALASGIADKNALIKVKAQGYILLALDGQRPEAGHKSLWYFLDVGTDQVLHTEYLDIADTPTLKCILKEIQAKFQVPIKAVVSDHQSSIIKAVKEALPNALHQCCHFHFLKNLWRPLEAIDRHLLLVLSTAVNGLYINRITVKRLAIGSGKAGESIRDFFLPIMQDLKLVIDGETKAFDHWAGVDAFIGIKEAKARLQELISKATQPWQKTMLEHTIKTLNAALEESKEFFDRLQILIPRFNQIRRILGKEYATMARMKAVTRKWLTSQKKFLQLQNADQPDENRRIKRLTYQTTSEKVIDQWICFYNSHEPGLFTFMEVDGLPRTNVGMEQDFSHENRFFRFHYGQLKVGYNVRVYGGAVLRVLKHYKSGQTRVILKELDKGIEWKLELAAFQMRSRQERKQRNSKKNRSPWEGINFVAKRLGAC